ncbi:MAG TPA: hypothetical protein VII75_04080 [Thermoanaerobaculia bacterium]|nr:hypothetical protein [Thermoanaerobaculia bacterium]
MSTTGPGPSVTSQERIAKDVREVLNAAAALIPKLEQPHPAALKGLRASRTVSKEQLARMSAIVEQSEVLQRLGTFDVEEARETLQFLDAFRPIADQIAALLAAVNHTMEARKARVVDAGLRTYAVAKALARDEESAELYGALDAFRTQMRQSRRRDRNTSA